jgi:hypothetical protein
MIKLILWTDDTAPPFILEDEGKRITFYDYPTLWDFKLKDQIHYASRIGTTVFEITMIEPANLKHFPPEMQQVTARRKS